MSECEHCDQGDCHPCIDHAGRQVIGHIEGIVVPRDEYERLRREAINWNMCIWRSERIKPDNEDLRAHGWHRLASPISATRMIADRLVELGALEQHRYIGDLFREPSVSCEPSAVNTSESRA